MTDNIITARLFIDMDGTLAAWQQAACFEDLLQENYFRDLPPYQTVVDAVRILCNAHPELDIYALSAFMPENPASVEEKYGWLDVYVPEIDAAHRIFVPCGNSKAAAAANRLKMPCIDMVTETYQLRDGDKLIEFYNGIDWKPLFEFVRRYYGVGVEQLPTTCLKPNGRIEVNWPENLRDKCGLFGHTYREVYLQTFSSCCFHDITYDKDIVDKYLARPDFYRLNISLENDCNGTSSDAYLQLTFSLKHIEFSGGYNFANLFSAEYRKDTGWFVVSGEGEVLMGAKK